MFDISLGYGGAVIRGLVLSLRLFWRGFEMVSTVLDSFWHITAVIFLVGMWLLLLLNTISRWLETDSIQGWPLELVSYMLVWTIFVMLGPAARWNKHIRVTYFSGLLLGEKRGEILMQFIENTAGLSFATFMAIHAYRWVDLTHRMNVEYPSAGGWEYPMWIVRSGLFVGFALLAYFYFERLVNWIITVTSQISHRGNK